MNSELKKCRDHYEELLHANRKTPTAQFLLKAIHIAEHLQEQLASNSRDARRAAAIERALDD